MLRIFTSAILAVLAAVAAATLLALPTSAAAPSGELAFAKVGYNANGADTLSNRWKEYIDLKNVTGSPVNVDGWFTQDAWAHAEHGDTTGDNACNTAVFTKMALRYLNTDADNDGTDDGLWLPAGDVIRVYTAGADDATAAGPHTMAINKPGCGYNGHYLGNGGDTIRVKKKDGTLVAIFTYSFEHGYWIR
ncbi:lamin tail domain-containing protein [Nonomuraea fuscirosea]